MTNSAESSTNKAFSHIVFKTLIQLSKMQADIDNINHIFKTKEVCLYKQMCLG